MQTNDPKPTALAFLQECGSSVTTLEVAVASGKKSNYHARAKQIPLESANKVLSQENFLEGIRVMAPKDIRVHELNSLMNEFLEQKFFNMKDLGITVGLDKEIDQQNEARIIQELIKNYEDQGMGGQMMSVNEEFRSLRASQNIFLFVKKCAENNQFDERHTMLLHAVSEIIDKLSVGEKAFVLTSLADICEWNSLAGRYRVPLPVDTKYLPELFTACPVWFAEGSGVENLGSQDDPRPDQFTKHICDLVGTKNFAWFYQMYNRRTRIFSQFEGPDIMPPHILKAIPELKKKFDYLVIATPYHDKAAKEWADPSWHANIDPFLLGFKKSLKSHFVMIDRWSGTGLLPLMVDMIADTMGHIKSHQQLLANFFNDAYWYKGNKNHEILGDNLSRFGADLLKKFNNNNLFQFLRTA